MFRVVVVTLLCAVAHVHGQSTPISQCRFNRVNMPLNAYVEGCTQTPCPLTRGTDAQIQLVFKSPRMIRRMRTLATADMGIPFPYGLGEQAETCNFLSNTYCPIQANEIVQYTIKLKMEESFPTIPVTIELRIEDENRAAFTCLRLPVRVV